MILLVNPSAITGTVVRFVKQDGAAYFKVLSQIS
jgi:hypothetical protein